MNYLFIVEFEINFLKNNSTKIEFFLIIKNYIFNSKFAFSKSITKDYYARREMRNANKIFDNIFEIN